MRPRAAKCGLFPHKAPEIEIQDPRIGPRLGVGLLSPGAPSPVVNHGDTMHAPAKGVLGPQRGRETEGFLDFCEPGEHACCSSIRSGCRGSEAQPVWPPSLCQKASCPRVEGLSGFRRSFPRFKATASQVLSRGLIQAELPTCCMAF